MLSVGCLIRLFLGRRYVTLGMELMTVKQNDTIINAAVLKVVSL